MRHYEQTKEGNRVEFEDDNSVFKFAARVMWVDLDYIHAEQSAPRGYKPVHFRVNRQTKKVHKWTPTGWDPTDLRLREVALTHVVSDEDFMGD